MLRHITETIKAKMHLSVYKEARLARFACLAVSMLTRSASKRYEYFGPFEAYSNAEVRINPKRELSVPDARRKLLMDANTPTHTSGAQLFGDFHLVFPE